jgi:hypothetical protein
MPTFEFSSPEGKTYSVDGPDGATQEQAWGMLQQQIGAQKGAPAAPAPSPAPGSDQPLRVADVARMVYKGLNNVSPVGPVLDALGTGDPIADLKNVVAGGVRGAGSIGATLLSPVDKAMGTSNDERRADMDKALTNLGADTSAPLFGLGKVGAEIAGTAGAGGAIGNGLRALPLIGRAAAPLATAIESGGMTTGLAPSSLIGQAGNLLLRGAGGAVSGAAQAGLVDPSQAGTGALIGGATPIATALAGKAAQGIGSVLRGPDVPDATRQAAQQAIDAGYVIPPTQVKPTLVNRLLEGTAGKLTTAQNASAANQSVTNNLAKNAIGATELTPDGLAAVRRNANAAYDVLGNAGTFKTDDAFRQALDQAGARSSKFAADFPELVNKDSDGLLQAFAGKDSFDAQSAIEAIKRLREGQRAALGSPMASAEAKAFGRTQGNVADALEGVVERNLQQSGSTDLLDRFRDARQTLAKTYDVEKALNQATGNVDAKKLAAQLDKGRPLVGDLRTIAEFGSAFPTAAKMPEKMGSLPQVSPLDLYGALGGAGIGSFLTGPAGMLAGVAVPAGRVAARYAALSPMVQRGLAKAPSSAPGLLSHAPELQPLLLRSAPVIGTISGQ